MSRAKRPEMREREEGGVDVTERRGGSGERADRVVLFPVRGTIVVFSGRMVSASAR